MHQRTAAADPRLHRLQQAIKWTVYTLVVGRGVSGGATIVLAGRLKVLAGTILHVGAKSDQRT